MSNHFIEYLWAFNRKERFHLLCYATGTRCFPLADKFRKKVNEQLGTKIPKDDGCAKVWTALDYHLDWLYCAVYLAFIKPTALPDTGMSKEFKMPTTPDCYKGNQEDIDFLIAYPDKDDNEKTHLILLEAKGVTGWSNEQMESKATRLKAIFESNKKHFQDKLEIYFAVVSPSPPKNLETADYPVFMKGGATPKALEQPKHIRLELPSGLKQPIRRHKKSDKDGYSHWAVKSLGTKK